MTPPGAGGASARVALPDARDWPVQRSVTADLDADGVDGRLVLASDVAAGSEAGPHEEGGRRWALWAAERAPDSARTLYGADALRRGRSTARTLYGADALRRGRSTARTLYGALVPEGDVDVAVEQPSIGEAPDVLVLERTPTQVRVMEVRYHAPGDARLVSTAHHQPRLWLTGPASATDPAERTD